MTWRSRSWPPSLISGTLPGPSSPLTPAVICDDRILELTGGSRSSSLYISLGGRSRPPREEACRGRYRLAAETEDHGNHRAATRDHRPAGAGRRIVSRLALRQ